jgi:iron complex outermembrane receptor protein
LVAFVYNAQKATIRGGELEVSMLPTKNLELSGYVSSTNAHYDQWLAPTGTGLPWVNPSSPTGALAQNSKFAFVPKMTASATVRYTLPLSTDIGKVAVQYNWYRQDEQQMTDLNDPFGVIPAYAISNASIEWTQVMNNPFDLRLWVKNLADKEYATGGTSVYTSTGLSTRILGAPRTVGLDLTYRF